MDKLYVNGKCVDNMTREELIEALWEAKEDIERARNVMSQTLNLIHKLQGGHHGNQETQQSHSGTRFAELGRC
ncbi:hypothetical protein GWO43_09035 [candidate division KSB1 bacterium]|nr:hypothetical protein [candidate division KSB1 bacterium]NIR73095.1 hypothetical protein [candidate division KSB1 bacterium]NIS24104.1 hypothetical protein [candidate division KSB1 bacterium]NIT71024.1 hypothetical protein [candidate division KSB1 bacterium]NIU24724.1 hypothetical protein [candidate division KSB1 bacterium]